MKIVKQWKKNGSINSDGTISWSNKSMEQQILNAKNDEKSCGYVTEKIFMFANGCSWSFVCYYFFGHLVEREYVIRHFSQSPGLESWLKGYNKTLFIFVPQGKYLFKIKDNQKICFVSR